jgi:hypothetical protein
MFKYTRVENHGKYLLVKLLNNTHKKKIYRYIKLKSIMCLEWNDQEFWDIPFKILAKSRVFVLLQK